MFLSLKPPIWARGLKTDFTSESKKKFSHCELKPVANLTLEKNPTKPGIMRQCERKPTQAILRNRVNLRLNRFARLGLYCSRSLVHNMCSIKLTHWLSVIRDKQGERKGLRAGFGQNCSFQFIHEISGQKPGPWSGSCLQVCFCQVTIFIFTNIVITIRCVIPNEPYMFNVRLHCLW